MRACPGGCYWIGPDLCSACRKRKAKRSWSPAAETKLRSLYLSGVPTTRIAFLLKRSENAIGQHAKKMGLSRKRAGVKHWSPAEIRELRRRYPDELTMELAKHFGCSERAVFQKANDLGLRKSEAGRAVQAELARQKALTDPRIIASRIKKGAVPPNKGLRRPGWAPGRMAETQFKKGVRQGVAVKLYQPIGTERISKDGYLERKVNDDLPLQARWRAVHRIVWEVANGPIPPGHAVAFLPGRHTTDASAITVDALELVSRAELMRRNTFHNYPPEIAHAVHLRAALSRQINKRTKGEASK